MSRTSSPDVFDLLVEKDRHVVCDDKEKVKSLEKKCSTIWSIMKRYEKTVDYLEKKCANLQQVIVELRNENEVLRKDREFDNIVPDTPQVVKYSGRRRQQQQQNLCTGEDELLSSQDLDKQGIFVVSPPDDKKSTRKEDESMNSVPNSLSYENDDDDDGDFDNSFVNKKRTPLREIVSNTTETTKHFVSKSVSKIEDKKKNKRKSKENSKTISCKKNRKIEQQQTNDNCLGNKKKIKPYFSSNQGTRKKQDREALDGHACPDCTNFNKVIASSGFSPDTIKKGTTKCSRHRYNHPTPPSTPLHFWTPWSLSSTQNSAEETQDVAR